jgi:hypothetical protein
MAGINVAAAADDPPAAVATAVGADADADGRAGVLAVLLVAEFCATLRTFAGRI